MRASPASPGARDRSLLMQSSMRCLAVRGCFAGCVVGFRIQLMFTRFARAHGMSGLDRLSPGTTERVSDGSKGITYSSGYRAFLCWHGLLWRGALRSSRLRDSVVESRVMSRLNFGSIVLNPCVECTGCPITSHLNPTLPRSRRPDIRRRTRCINPFYMFPAQAFLHFSCSGEQKNASSESRTQETCMC